VNGGRSRLKTLAPDDHGHGLRSEIQTLRSRRCDPDVTIQTVRSTVSLTSWQSDRAMCSEVAAVVAAVQWPWGFSAPWGSSKAIDILRHSVAGR